MLHINIGDTVYLTKGNASITDTVEKFTVGTDIDGEECVLSVRLKELCQDITLSKEVKWSAEPWTVDEVNCESPVYTMPEIDAIGDLIKNFPTIR